MCEGLHALIRQWIGGRTYLTCIFCPYKIAE